jgi:ABC-2 type transport system permease protein
VGEAFAIYRRLAGARLRSDLQYRTSFFLFFSAQFLVTFLDFLAIAVIFGQVPRLGGWSLAEVAFLYGASGVAFGLADMFVSQVELVPERVRDGTFDIALIRPIGSLLQIVADDFALRRMGKVLQATIILAVALTRVHVHWTAGRVAMLVVMLVSGTVIFSAVWVITGALCFWLLEGREVMNSITYGGNFMTEYPMQIYGVWLRRFVVFVTGVAFVNFFPALYILGRPDTLGLPGFVRFLSPAVALVAAGGAAGVWQVAVRHYRSTGS